MTLSIACKDVDVKSNCNFVATANTEDELLSKVAQHAKEAHGMTAIDADTAAKVKAAIKRS
jgi:predicted small metal-binding protein